jgi:hypothetical protein
MSKFVGRPLEVQAEQYRVLSHFDRHHADQREAERLRAALGIDDPKRLVAGSLPGWIEFFNPPPHESGVLRPGAWLVHWPEGLLSALEAAQFERLFVAAQRQDPRIRVLKFGLIVFQPGDCSIRSRIVDVSETGAMLMPDDILLCPNEFALKPDVGVLRHCEVRWRKGTNMGVRFLNSRASIALV